MIYAILISILIMVILFLLFARKDKYNGLLRVSKQIEELNTAIEAKNKELENRLEKGGTGENAPFLTGTMSMTFPATLLFLAIMTPPVIFCFLYLNG